VQAEAGVITPNPGYLKKVREICNEKGILLVFDEIQTGFGRTGSLFFLEQCGVTPDVLCLAKALGGGMPLGAFIADQSVMRSLTFDPVLGHITTFGGHPVSCAAANAALNILTRERIYAQVEDKAKHFYDNLITHPLVKEIRYAGLLMAVDMPDSEILDKVFISLIEHKILTDRFLFKPEAFRIAPPLTISFEEIDYAIRTIRKVLDSFL
jgi:acetylornithine/succinyldiaminopimelate/putrescine aminotransferase